MGTNGTSCLSIEEESGGSAAARRVDSEVPANKGLRRHTAAYKLSVLERADRCNEPGQIGALLRREGLYSANLTKWRREREAGILDGLSPKKRGRKARERNPLEEENEKLKREKEKLERKLKQAEAIIKAQKKLSELLGIALPAEDELPGKK